MEFKEIEKRKIVEHNDLITSVAKMDKVPLKFFCVRLLSHIPQSWLPDKWSDFSFWSAKLRKTMEAFRWYIVFPKTMAQAERLMSGIGCIIKCGAAALLIGAV